MLRYTKCVCCTNFEFNRKCKRYPQGIPEEILWDDSMDSCKNGEFHFEKKINRTENKPKNN